MVRIMSMVSISLPLASVWSILGSIPGVLEKSALCRCCCGICYCTVRLCWLVMPCGSSVFLLVLCLIVLSVAGREWRHWSPQIQLWICLFLFRVYHVCFQDIECVCCGWSFVLIWVQVWIHLGSYVFLVGWFVFHYVLYLSLVIFPPLWRPLYFDININ